MLLIFVLPWPGLVLYGLFGRAYLPKKRIQMQERVSHLIKTTGKQFLEAHSVHPQLPSESLSAVTLAENLGDFPILGGNQVELITDYRGAIDRLVADIDAARSHVHLLYYIFADDDVGRNVFDALTRAVHRGVHCRVMIDSLGSKAWRRTLIPKMQAAGIEAQEMLPVRWYRRNAARMDLRNHRKIAVVDGRVAHVGSQNLVDPNFKEDITYEELVARITGPLALQLQAVFLADRFFEKETILPDKQFFPDPEHTGDVAGQVLPSGPGYPQANNQRLIVNLMYAAQKRVVITTPYFIPDDALLLAMETAVQRGVDVHLVVSQQADQFLVGLAQRSYYEDLLAAGVKIHRYKKCFLHAKHLSIDDTIAIVGSSNMDMRSFLLNAEVMAIFYDATVAKQLRAVQERYFSLAAELTLAEWRQRPFLTKTLQNMARLVDSLL
ncbi:MAG: cardiolipin synthase [Planctomycetes bacterium]|nr:cardiolipin synthase [Planctomycetota bacterium]